MSFTNLNVVAKHSLVFTQTTQLPWYTLFPQQGNVKQHLHACCWKREREA